MLSRQDSSSNAVSANSHLGQIQGRKNPTRTRGTSSFAAQVDLLAVVCCSVWAPYCPSVSQYRIIS